MKRLILFLLLIAFFCVGALFSYFNPVAVRVDYLFGEIELPLGLILVAVFGGTLLLAVLVFSLWSLAQRAELRRLRRKLDLAEAELANLRNLPLNNP